MACAQNWKLQNRKWVIELENSLHDGKEKSMDVKSRICSTVELDKEH